MSKKKICGWKYIHTRFSASDRWDVWRGSCGLEYKFDYGARPADYIFHFCPCCGKIVVVVKKDKKE
jgi:hypothetical protein